MEITFQHVCDPCEYLLFDNVCTVEELQKCFLEAQLLSPAFKEPNKTGSAEKEGGGFKKQNSGIFFNEIYTPNFAFSSPMTASLHKIVEIAKEREYTAFSLMNYFKNISGYNVLLSGYKNGDYYESHRDASVLTLLFWFGEENFTGGDLIFTDFDHTVLFKSNRAILFPSYYSHEITEIKSNSENYVRFSATAFLVVDGTRQHKQPATVGTNDF